MFRKQKTDIFDTNKQTMNFLAHIYLSNNNDLIKIGNFMADGIRGKHFETYPKDIQIGIVLHRAIDTYTDAHPVFRQSKHRLHQDFGHYSGIIVDIFYDHFLAKNWSQFSDEKLSDYVQNFYQSLYTHWDFLNDKTKHLLPYMKVQNWLESYQSLEGLHQILVQMDKRMQNESNMSAAIAVLKKYYNEFETEFFEFFINLQSFSNEKLNLLCLEFQKS
ncbi:acyl carrier protein phosphodiesterase [Flavobacterium branchiophilum]